MGAKGYMNTIMDEVCHICNRGTCEECGSFLVIKKAIAEAQLEAVEKWMAMTYDCIGNNGVIATEHFNYLAALRKAAGRGNDEGLRDYSYGWTCYHSGNHSYWN